MLRFTTPTVYLIIRGAFALADAIMFTTYALYYVNELGFNPLQLILVGTAVEVTVFLFEVPTGVVADSYSRRLSVIIGTATLGASYVLSAGVPYLGHLVPFFAAIVCAEVVRGIGHTFLSGAFDAWINDEVGTDKVGALYLKAGKIGSIMRLLGIAASAALANLRLNLPYFAGGSLFLLLAVFMLLAMREEGFTPRPRENRSTWQLMSGTFMDGVQSVRGRPILLALLLLTLIGGIASEGYQRLWEAHLLVTFRLPELGALSPATWFGLIAAAGSVLHFLVTHAGEKRLNLTNPRAVSATLLVAHTLRMLFTFGFAYAASFEWALGFYLAGGMLNAIYDPVYNTWVNQHIDSRVRATVLSMMGQMDALGQSGGGPVVGWVGTRFTIRAALALAGTLVSPALAVYTWVFRRETAAAGTAEIAAD